MSLFCCALAVLSMMRHPLNQTEEIVLKHVSAAEVDARLSEPGLSTPKDLGWTVDYKRDSLKLTGSAESTKSIKSTIDSLDRRPIRPLKLTVRKLRLSEGFKSELDWQVSYPYLHMGPASTVPFPWDLEYASIGKPEDLAKLNKIPADDAKELICDSVGHARFAWNGPDGAVVFTVFLRLNLDSVSVGMVLKKDETVSKQSIQRYFSANRRIRLGGTLLVKQPTLGYELAITVTE